MEEQSISLNGVHLIVIKAHGDLNLQGWDQPEMRVLIGETRSVRVSQEGDALHITCLDACDLSVPAGMAVCLEKVGGDCFVRSLTGSLNVQKVGGDLAIAGAGDIEIAQVGGDCQVSQGTGRLSVSHIGGDFNATAVHGAAALNHIGGDAQVKLEFGPLDLRAGGDVIVAVSKVDAPISLRAGGDALLHIPADTNANLNLESGGDSIEIKVGLIQESVTKWAYGAKLGNGGIPVAIDAGGDVEVLDDPWDEELINEQAREMDDHWKEVENQRKEEITRTSQWPRIEDITRRYVRRGEEAARRAEERAQAAVRRLEHHSHRNPGDFWQVPGETPLPSAVEGFLKPIENLKPRPKVSSEERLLILQMLSEKKITADEAEKLLQALES
jgi:hypothetical protein